MRGKRSKQYRKLMQQYGMTFGFREPYQILLDAAILQDASRFKMDFAGGLERTLHGQIKPMITQCSMRHLYSAEPKDEALIDHAKGFERRRCGHHELEKPLSTLECFKEVMDPKGSMTNKNRYVVACQDPAVRAYLRKIPGVPMIYIKRSVMIMEPMADASESVKAKEDKAKFKAGLKSVRGPAPTLKRARGGADVGENENEDDSNPEPEEDQKEASSQPPPKKRKRGPSGPNPLSMKKKVKKPLSSDVVKPVEASPVENGVSDAVKIKRKRKHKSKKDGQDEDRVGTTTQPEIAT